VWVVEELHGRLGSLDWPVAAFGSGEDIHHTAGEVGSVRRVSKEKVKDFKSQRTCWYPPYCCGGVGCPYPPLYGGCGEGGAWGGYPPYCCCGLLKRKIVVAMTASGETEYSRVLLLRRVSRGTTILLRWWGTVLALIVRLSTVSTATWVSVRHVVDCSGPGAEVRS
jgi:hypothetical protein